MYEALAPYYNELFPASDVSARFLSSRCREYGRVLDIACGVGAHTRKLGQAGFEVTGVDLDEKMISFARESGGGESCEFIVGDMMNLPEILKDNTPFDLAYCLGNSIVHLKDRDSVAACIASIASILSPGGSCVVQIVNFERMESGREFTFEPLVSGDRRISFDRRYETGEDSHSITFHTRLTVDGALVSDDRIPLVTISKDELVGIFNAAGFRDVKAFGSFSGKAWDTDGFLTIVTGRRS